jgi:predicted TIM-barrel fold metal-dependent hydrolase
MPPSSVPIIDIHMHTFTIETIYGYGEGYLAAANFFGQDPKSPFHVWVREGRAIPIEETYEFMKRAGVVRAVIQNEIAFSKSGSMLPNDFLAEYCRKFPDFFMGFCGVDPRTPEGALYELQRCHDELGLVGLKFHPAWLCLWPNDKELMYPIYEKLCELDMAILYHMGATRLAHSHIKYAQPVTVDEVATDFPGLRIVVAHCGWPWTQEALALLWRHENVVVDFSGRMPEFLFGNDPAIMHFMNILAPDKFVFGTDYPVLAAENWLEQFDSIHERGYEWAGKHCDWNDGVYEKFVFYNACRFLKLDPEAILKGAGKP